jgi:HSP20 family protein
MSSSNKYKKQRRQKKNRVSKDTGRTLRPKLSDFKRRGVRGGEEKEEEYESEQLPAEAQNRGSMSMRRRARAPGEGRSSLRTQRMDSIFDNFRNSIESIMDPLSSWGYFPSYGRLQMEGESSGVRTPVYDLVDDGDKYKLIVELPGIDKDNIRIKAMDDSVEISAEQSEEEDERKKNFVYNRRSYSSFYCRIPVPEEILSSEVTAKADNKGILRVQLPKKTRPQDIKSRSIIVE